MERVVEMMLSGFAMRSMGGVERFEVLALG
jgi:hypothetical protein